MARLKSPPLNAPTRPGRTMMECPSRTQGLCLQAGVAQPSLLPGGFFGGCPLPDERGCSECGIWLWMDTLLTAGSGSSGKWPPKLQTSWASLATQTVKNPPTRQKKRVRSLGQENPLGEEMATHSSILAGIVPWTEEPDGQEPGGLQSMGSQRVRHN